MDQSKSPYFIICELAYPTDPTDQHVAGRCTINWGPKRWCVCLRPPRARVPSVAAGGLVLRVRIYELCTHLLPRQQLVLQHKSEHIPGVPANCHGMRRLDART